MAHQERSAEYAYRQSPLANCRPMRTLRRSFRLFRLLLHTVASVFFGLAAALSRQPERWSQRWFAGLLNVLNVEVLAQGKTAPQPALVVGNHQSWLDIAVLSALKPVVFVSKADVARWPLIGLLARAGDTLFIERGAHGTQQLNQQISARLAQGRCVVIFPEATTTRGPGVRRFQPRLFAGAIEQQSPVLPFALRYSSPRAPYVDDQTLVGNLWALLGEARIQVEVHFGPTLKPGTTRDALARRTQGWVEQALRQPPAWLQLSETEWLEVPS